MTDSEIERAIVSALKPMEPKGLVVKRLLGVVKASSPLCKHFWVYSQNMSRRYCADCRIWEDLLN